MKQKIATLDVANINFQSQHWWNRYKTKRNMGIDEEKAALIYEAMRRRSEVRQAWVDGKSSFGDNGWQHFTGWVVINLPLPWPELDSISQRGMVDDMHSPWFVPPRGYSTFPDKSCPDKCKVAAMQVLRLPEPGDSSKAAEAFVEHARRFVEAGFLIVAVDNKTNQSIDYASSAMKVLPRSFRKVDIGYERIAHLPPNISASDMRAVEEKQQQGTFTQTDLDELWRNYQKPATSINSQWKRNEEVRPIALNKRKRGGVVVEEKLFNFVEICSDFERVDSGLSPKGDFIRRLRL